MPKKYLSDAQALVKTEWDLVVEKYADIPTVYFFSADGCGFCATALPYVEDLEKKYEQYGVQVIEFESEKHGSIVRAAKVDQFPTYMFYANGNLVGKSNGWDDEQKTKLEKELGLLQKYQTVPGLSNGTSEPQKVSGCGSTSDQVAEIASGIQEAMDALDERFDSRIKAILVRLDKIDSRIEQSVEEIINSSRRGSSQTQQCKCGKHVVSEE